MVDQARSEADDDDGFFTELLVQWAGDTSQAEATGPQASQADFMTWFQGRYGPEDPTKRSEAHDGVAR